MEGVFAICFAVVFDAFERSAEKHVDDLRSAADSEDGKIVRREIRKRVQFRLVADKIYIFGVDAASVKGGQNVSAAGEQKPAVFTVVTHRKTAIERDTYAFKRV